MQQFSDFLETFPESFLSSKFSEFLVEWKSPGEKSTQRASTLSKNNLKMNNLGYKVYVRDSLAYRDVVFIFSLWKN